MIEQAKNLEPETEEVNTPLTPEEKEKIRAQIIHMLGIYPVLSPTTLQGALGPYKRAHDWKPVLEELIAEGVVVREYTEQIMTPAGRYNSYTLIMLAPTQQAKEKPCSQ